MSVTPAYDAVVAGLGAMGSAAAYHLARRGARVLGLDRFAPPHALGSSHGKSRIIREAYFEHPLYVPLVRRAYEGWSELEARSGERLYLRTGGLMLGPPDGVVVGGARRSALEHGLPYEELSAAELGRRFPAFQPRPGTVAIHEPRAGLLIPEAAIEAHLGLARRHGAELRFHEPLVEWRAAGDGVEVTTPGGRYTASRLVLAAGAWTARLLPVLAPPLAIERNALCWLEPARPTDLFTPERFPVFIWEFEPGTAWYGFPDTGAGIKVAVHHQGDPGDPDAPRREATADEVARIRALVRQYLPAADGAVRETATCMYTNTPDHHFLIDTHPEHPAVIIASPCSGHGFKFATVVGEILAELALDGASRFDLAPFRIARLLRPA